MLDIVLSIILVFGLPGGPTNDFDTGTSDGSAAVTQNVKPAKQAK